jgi:hypothetical protein
MGGNALRNMRAKRGFVGDSNTLRVVGTVLWFDEAKRFGFIKPDNGEPSSSPRRCSYSRSPVHLL